MAATEGHKIRHVLRAVSDPQIEVEAYYDYMEQLGSHLARAGFHEKYPPKSSFHVICAVEDFDHIGKKFIDELRGLGHVAHFSCLWAEHEILSREPLLDYAPINRTYDEPLTRASYHLVVIASAVGSVTPVECMLLRMFSLDDRPNYQSITIAAPFIINTAISELKRKLAPCFDGEVKRCGLEINRKLWRDGSPNPGLGMRGAARVGLGETALLRRYIPPYIRTLISTPRDPGPKGSMEPGPDGGPTPAGGGEIDVSILRKHGYLTDFEVPPLNDEHSATFETEAHIDDGLIPSHIYDKKLRPYLELGPQYINEVDLDDTAADHLVSEEENKLRL